MGDAIFFGVLRMPPDLWSDDPLDQHQRYSRYVQAADEIEALRAEVERLRGFLLDCHRVYSSGQAWRDKYLCDAIDNDGQPYQSQALADYIAAMEASNAG